MVGFLQVINLAPHHAENALSDERAALRSLGMEYVPLVGGSGRKPWSDRIYSCARLAAFSAAFAAFFAALAARLAAFCAALTALRSSFMACL